MSDNDGFEQHLHDLLLQEADDRIAAVRRSHRTYAGSATPSRVRRGSILRVALTGTFVAAVAATAAVSALHGGESPRRSSSTTIPVADIKVPICPTSWLTATVRRIIPPDVFVEGGSASSQGSGSREYDYQVFVTSRHTCTIGVSPMLDMAGRQASGLSYSIIGTSNAGTWATTAELSPGLTAGFELWIVVPSDLLAASAADCSFPIELDMRVEGDPSRWAVRDLPGLSLRCGASGQISGTYSSLPSGNRGSFERVVIAGGCPASLADIVSTDSTGASPTGPMVPTGPEKGLICRYGSSFTGGKLYRDVHLGRAAATQLAQAIDGVAIANPSAPPVVSGCPADIGSGTIIVFGYGTAHPDADVWYADSGCQDITNGTVSGVELANPSFLSFISAFNTAFQTRGAAG